jgi:hypothetical protein
MGTQVYLSGLEGFGAQSADQAQEAFAQRKARATSRARGNQ